MLEKEREIEDEVKIEVVQPINQNDRQLLNEQNQLLEKEIEFATASPINNHKDEENLEQKNKQVQPKSFDSSVVQQGFQNNIRRYQNKKKISLIKK